MHTTRACIPHVHAYHTCMQPHVHACSHHTLCSVLLGAMGDKGDKGMNGTKGEEGQKGEIGLLKGDRGENGTSCLCLYQEVISLYVLHTLMRP